MTTKNLKQIKGSKGFLTRGNLKWWFALGCVFTVIAFNTRVSIICYPWWIWLVFSIPFLGALAYWQRNDFLDELKGRKPLARIGALLAITISYTLFSFLVSSVLVGPFNIYVIQSVRSEPTSTYYVPIQSVSVSNRSGSYLTFNFKGEVVKQYLSKKKAAELEKNDVYKNYVVCLKVSPGPLGTYVIKDWEIVHK